MERRSSSQITSFSDAGRINSGNSTHEKAIKPNIIQEVSFCFDNERSLVLLTMGCSTDHVWLTDHTGSLSSLTTERYIGAANTDPVRLTDHTGSVSSLTTERYIGVATTDPVQLTDHTGSLSSLTTKRYIGVATTGL